MKIELSTHAREKMEERQVTERQVKKAVKHGACERVVDDYSPSGIHYVFTRDLNKGGVVVVANMINRVMVVITTWRRSRPVT